jgi:hypothetical protein
MQESEFRGPRPSLAVTTITERELARLRAIQAAAWTVSEAYANSSATLEEALEEALDQLWDAVHHE